MVESIRVVEGMERKEGIVAGDCWDRLQELQADYWEGKTSHSKGKEHMEHMGHREVWVGWVGWSVGFWEVEAMDRRYVYLM